METISQVELRLFASEVAGDVQRYPGYYVVCGVVTDNCIVALTLSADERWKN